MKSIAAVTTSVSKCQIFLKWQVGVWIKVKYLAKLFVENYPHQLKILGLCSFNTHVTLSRSGFVLVYNNSHQITVDVTVSKLLQLAFSKQLLVRNQKNKSLALLYIKSEWRGWSWVWLQESANQVLLIPADPQIILQ